ncbi:MAG TPA: glycosyltransferase [Candidatus Wunengus sp. YC60]|uniref:glycosyltransferase n=1 Tax=Candidatus Wunengus sp. YC60 TaxID=3367697 RepID=UPI004025B80B
MKPKLLYVGMKYDYGDKARGLSFEHRNFYHSLKSYCEKQNWDFVHYDFMERGLALGLDLMTQELYELAKKEKPIYLFAVLFDFHRDPGHEVFKHISSLGTITIHWFCDDHWRFEKYSSVVAPHFDFICTTANSALPKYEKLGISNKVIKSQWACNYELYVPYDIEKDFDISFVGQPHGNRVDILSKLVEGGLKLEVFGFGWKNRPRIPFHQMVRLFSRSKINLNLSNSSTLIGQQIKGRNFEIPGTRSFLLTSNAENLSEYYEDGKEIVIFHSAEEFVEKAKYYLKNEDERNTIATNGYKRTINEHTWHHRYDKIFSSINVERRCSVTSGGKTNRLVSVIIPCYNQALFLPEVVESVVNQAFTDWECIIVNDGSPDNTSEVARQLIGKYYDKQIMLVEKENGGLSDARNAGIKSSTGKYVLPLDADDLIHPEMLKKTVSLLESHPEIAIAYTDVKHFGSANRVVYAGEYDFKRLCRENHLSYCSLYRREAWDAVNGYNPNMVLGYEDWDFWISCGEKGYYGKRIPEPLFMYRVKESSMYTKALEHHGELMARIILNHPCLYGQKHALEAKIILDQCSTGKLKTDTMVSVIVPTYNRPDTLKRTLESIAAQTYKRIEAIVVNDAGKDVSGVIDAFQDRLSIKYLVHDKNKGLAAVRNTAIKHASGQYIAYLDDDDIFLPHHIETTLKILTTTDYKVVYTDAYRSYQTKTGNTYQVIKKDIPYSVDYSKGIFYNTNITPVLCVVHDRTCFDEVGVFDESLPVLEDWDLWIRMAEKYDFCHIKDVTCEFSWRVDRTTTTSSKQDEFARVRELIYKKYYNQFQAALMQTSAVTQKPVSIIILTWNALDCTQKCVHSIQNHTRYPHEIIFIDNASNDGTVEYLRNLVRECPNYKLIENQENKGFAAGNNQGVAAASGEYVMLLNNDVLVSDNWLNGLVESLEIDKNIGMVGPITNSISGRQQVVSIPYGDEKGFHEFAQGIRRTYKGRLTPRNRIAGFAVLMKKALYEEVGGLDESFGTGNYEDDDLCLKVRGKGYAIMVDEGVFIHHHRSQTFIENKIDYHNNLSTNGSKFKGKWPNVDYEQLLELHGSLVDTNAALCTRGKQAIESGNINEAIEIYSKVLQTNPIDDTALCGLAIAFQIDGKMDKTIDAYKKALKANPSFFDAYYNLAIVYANNNQVDDAIAHLNKAINLNDSDASIHNNLGVLYFKKNMYNDAANCFERALQIDAHYKEAQQNLEKVSGVLEKT